MIRLSVNAVASLSGGGLTVLLGYLGGWRTIGAKLAIRVYASQPSVIDAVRSAHPEVEVVPFGVGLPLARRLIAQQTRLGPEIVRAGCDVVLSTNLLVARCPLPQIVHHQNLLLFEFRCWPAFVRRGLKRTLQAYGARRALRRSTANVVISEFMRGEVEAVVPPSRPRNVVILNGLGREALEAASRPSTWKGDPHLLAITADLPHKDNAGLVRMLAALVRERPEVDWSMSVVGSDRLFGARRLADDLGVGSRIAWPGFVDMTALDRLYRRSLCLVYPATLEGFGLPPLEAMARRCPVVAADSCAIPEVVGDAGILVPPGRSEAFAQAVLSLLDNPTLRDELIDRAVRRATGFRWETSAEKLDRLISRVAGPAPMR